MKFIYTAKNLSGEQMNGEMETRDRFELGRLLRQQGYTVISFKERKEKAFHFSSLFLSIFENIPASDKIIFSRNLSVMISAGVSLVKALDILDRQSENKKFKKILANLAENIKKGAPLSEGMKKYPKVFSSLFTAMVRVGEESGKLSESLLIVAEQLERDNTLRKKIKGAMMYPSIIVITMILIGILMLIYVVPTLVSTFNELGVELPLSTRIIIGLSNFFVQHTILFIMIALSVIAILAWLMRTSAGRKFFGALLLRIPLFSPLVKKINSARTSRTLASLISSGVDVLEALSITKDVLQNPRYKRVLEEAKTNIQKGSPISESFKKASNLYPILVGEMMAVGEETGKLSDMLLRLADFYEEEAAETTKNMATIIEPVLMVIIGAVVGFFAVSMIKPMYSMLSGI